MYEVLQCGLGWNTILLKRDAFRVTIFAFMQSVGLVNDHARICFRYRVLTR